MLASIYTDIREWLVAVGTVGAVIVALGLARRAEYLAWQRRPKLSLSFDPQGGIGREVILYPGARIDAAPGAYIRFAVKNQRGKDAAEDVEVLLAAILIPSFERDTEVVEVSFPGFVWTHTRSTQLTIPAGVERHVDIARIHEMPPPELENVLELMISPPPADGRHLLPGGVYELRLVISARNADAVNYMTRISYDPTRSAYAHEAVKVLDPPYLESRTFGTSK